MTAERTPGYEVGFRRPPGKTRFQKGCSGNPKRRRRAARSLAGLLEQALRETVVVTENSQRKKITKGEAVLKQLVNKGASGGARSIQLLLAQIRSIETELECPPSDGGQHQDTEQAEMLERLTIAERLELRRLLAKAQGEPARDEAAQPEPLAPLSCDK
jgi:hypothetical protein